ncbi:hypothetical protein D7V91_15230 [bacterium 1xD42-67]|nr:hypothetical protein D7V91_15230 [bacterium 1xD42-67]
MKEQRWLINSFVNSVTIFDDYILITFNYKGFIKPLSGQFRVALVPHRILISMRRAVSAILLEKEAQEPSIGILIAINAQLSRLLTTRTPRRNIYLWIRTLKYPDPLPTGTITASYP